MRFQGYEWCTCKDADVSTFKIPSLALARPSSKSPDKLQSMLSPKVLPPYGVHCCPSDDLCIQPRIIRAPKNYLPSQPGYNHSPGFPTFKDLCATNAGTVDRIQARLLLFFNIPCQMPLSLFSSASHFKFLTPTNVSQTCDFLNSTYYRECGLRGESLSLRSAFCEYRSFRLDEPLMRCAVVVGVYHSLAAFNCNEDV